MIRLSIFRLVWSLLPGPTWLRVSLSAVLFVAVVLALFTWVYPNVGDFLPDELTLDAAPSA